MRSDKAISTGEDKPATVISAEHSELHDETYGRDAQEEALVLLWHKYRESQPPSPTHHSYTDEALGGATR